MDRLYGMKLIRGMRKEIKTAFLWFYPVNPVKFFCFYIVFPICVYPSPPVVKVF